MGSTNVAKAGDARQITPTTWAAKPSVIGWYKITDVGTNGSLWFYDGTNWLPSGAISLAKKGAGWLVPSLIAANAATYTQSGTTITVTSALHNIPATTYNGYNVYLDFSSGAATDGWYSNFQRVDANTFTCTSSTSQTTSGGLNTNTSEITLTDLTTAIIGGSLGPNGLLRGNLLTSYLANTNSKTLKVKLGGSNIYLQNHNSASGTGAVNQFVMGNRNSASAQSSSSAGTPNNATQTSRLNTTIDTSVNSSLTVTVTVGTASDFFAVDYANFALEP